VLDRDGFSVRRSESIHSSVFELVSRPPYGGRRHARRHTAFSATPRTLCQRDECRETVLGSPEAVDVSIRLGRIYVCHGNIDHVLGTQTSVKTIRSSRVTIGRGSTDEAAIFV